MTSVFADTAAMIALADKSDRFHHQAIAVINKLRKFQTNFVTSDAVILELASYFSHSYRRGTAIALIETIRQSKRWVCIEIDKTLMAQGFERYKQMGDKNWSLVDCIGMIVAQKNGITEIFTTDHHFEQAGFTILLKS